MSKGKRGEAGEVFAAMATSGGWPMTEDVVQYLAVFARQRNRRCGPSEARCEGRLAAFLSLRQNALSKTGHSRLSNHQTG